MSKLLKALLTHQKLMKKLKKRNKFKFDLKKTAALCGLFFVIYAGFWFLNTGVNDVRLLSSSEVSSVSKPSDYHFIDQESYNLEDPDHEPANTPAIVQQTGVPVLMYHHVGHLPENPDAIRKDLTVSPEDFEKQMQYLHTAGYNSISLEQLQQSFEGKITLPSKPIAISFDDGYSDVFEYAVPILLEHDLMGSFAIITQDVGVGEYASWQEISEAHKQGMEIISHSRNHIDFTNPKYTETQKLDELKGARDDLKEKLGINTTVFIYPYGHVDSTAERLAREAGYNLALTTKFGLAASAYNHLQEPRVRVHGVESLETFARLIDPNYKLPRSSTIRSNPAKSLNTSASQSGK
jgi:peptidoglycan/xylan/chitin deacetylase (PgdA/CDA1 family)